MPNWQAIADAIGTGMWGEEIQAYKAKQQAMKNDEERMGFARDENRRANESAGRQAESYEFEKSQRPMLIKQLQQKIDAGELDLKEAQNQLALFDAEGGVEGEAGRRKTKRDQETATHEQSVRESRARIGNMAADNARAAAQEARAKVKDELLATAQRLENEFNQQTQAARIAGVNEANDPKVKDAQRLRALIDYAKIAPEEEMEWLNEEIKKLSVRNEVRKADQATAAAANPQTVATKPNFSQTDVMKLKMGGL